VITEFEAMLAAGCNRQGQRGGGITVAVNGHPWYAMPGANKIATLQLP
jgi:hypothetical protein